MKKLIVLIAALLAALLIAGCASKPAAPTGPSAAELLSNARGGAPDGVLVGQATAKGGSADQTAMRQLLRAMSYLAGEMIDEQAAGGRLTSSAASDFKVNVSTMISRSTLTGAVKVDSGTSAAGDGWAVYYLDKGEALKELNKAVGLAKEQVAGTSNFNTNNFDAKFALAAAREWKN